MQCCILADALNVTVYEAPGRNDEDELYETYICETNIVYCLHDEELVISDEYSGRPLKHSMLRTKEVKTAIKSTRLY